MRAKNYPDECDDADHTGQAYEDVLTILFILAWVQGGFVAVEGRGIILCKIYTVSRALKVAPNSYKSSFYSVYFLPFGILFIKFGYCERKQDALTVNKKTQETLKIIEANLVKLFLLFWPLSNTFRRFSPKNAVLSAAMKSGRRQKLKPMK